MSLPARCFAGIPLVGCVPAEPLCSAVPSLLGVRCRGSCLALVVSSCADLALLLFLLSSLPSFLPFLPSLLLQLAGYVLSPPSPGMQSDPQVPGGRAQLRAFLCTPREMELCGTGPSGALGARSPASSLCRSRCRGVACNDVQLWVSAGRFGDHSGAGEVPSVSEGQSWLRVCFPSIHVGAAVGGGSLPAPAPSSVHPLFHWCWDKYSCAHSVNLTWLQTGEYDNTSNWLAVNFQLGWTLCAGE